MFNLLLKDLENNILIILMFFIFVIAFNILFLESSFYLEGESAAATILITSGIFLHMIIYGTILQTEKIDNKFKINNLLNTLPISQGEIIISKYILLFIMALIGCLAIGVIGTLFSFPNNEIIIKYAFFYSGISLVSSGLTYTMLFKWGFEKTKIPVYSIYFIVMIIPQIGFIIFNETIGLDGTDQFNKLITGINIPLTIIISLLVYTGTCVLSIKTSNRS